MNTRCRPLVLLAAWALSGSAAATAQPRAPILSTIDVQVGVAPAVVNVSGRLHLVHELHVTNFRPSDVTLTRVEVLDAARGTVIADFSERALSSRLTRPGAPPDLPDRRVIAPGLRAVVYFWLPLDNAAPPPPRLRHRIAVDVVRAARRVPVVVSGAEADVRRERPLVLSPPLRGGPWVALYDPMLMGGHRTAIYAIESRARIPARFAIDFVRLENDGTHASGDRSLIANWHGYGAEVLAVADATVIEARDDLEEAPSLAGSQGPIPLENVSGNYVSLDLGGGRYAFYEHLKHGSLRVKAGDRVRAGDVLALLGNSGSSSSGPHLHFHVADAGAELAAEGLPYVFASFEAVGAFENVSAFTAGDRWTPMPAGTGGTREGELPAPNAVVVFAGGNAAPARGMNGGPMTLSGRTLTLTYESGLIVRGRYGADSVSWEALSGPAKGATGTERTYVSELSPARYFVSWVEASGTTVSQVLDLETRQVWSFVTYATGGSRHAMLDRGSIAIDDAA